MMLNRVLPISLCACGLLFSGCGSDTGPPQAMAGSTSAGAQAVGGIDETSDDKAGTSTAQTGEKCITDEDCGDDAYCEQANENTIGECTPKNDEANTTTSVNMDDGGQAASDEAGGTARADGAGNAGTMEAQDCINDLVCGEGRRCDKEENANLGVCVDADEPTAGTDGAGGGTGGAIAGASGDETSDDGGAMSNEPNPEDTGGMNAEGPNGNAMNLSNGAGAPASDGMGGNDESMGGSAEEPTPITFNTDRRALVRFEEVYTDGRPVPVTEFSVDFRWYERLPTERPVGEAWPDAARVHESTSGSCKFFDNSVRRDRGRGALGVGPLGEVDAGTLTFNASGVEVFRMVASADYLYNFDGDRPTDFWNDTGEEITIAADGMPADRGPFFSRFQHQMTSPANVTMATIGENGTVSRAGFDVGWEAGNGTQFVIKMKKPNSPLSVDCESPDDGRFTVPAAVFGHLDSDGEPTTELSFQLQRIVRAEILSEEGPQQGAVSIVLRSEWKPRMNLNVQ
ncbi:MAG: hypothetical protein VX589_06845 [Myxococcota bacterium]|nr:hypothetical protein [Myxococcota bacterium]